MKFTVEYPVASAGETPELVGPEGMIRVVKAAEQHGYDAVAFTEHPAPSLKWLEAGGHQSLDLTSALSFCAAVTERVRLMTYLMVLPYHNPFVAAKALATVDRLSAGRVTVVAGSGYLRSEFLALNVDMEVRNELFDEGLEVMRGAWSEVPYSHEGKHFRGKGVASLPGPVQPGGPPVLIGGNSAMSRRRAASAQGWSPLMVSEEVARTTRTPALATIEQLATRIEEVREAAVEQQGEGTGITIQVQTPECTFLQAPGSVEQHREHLGQLAGAGVDSFVLQPPGERVERCVEALQEYAETFLGVSSGGRR
ncbi:MAG TPA: TIGR03619 family F420-dependent LLM class oxidoreductase [Nocardioides sp.]